MVPAAFPTPMRLTITLAAAVLVAAASSAQSAPETSFAADAPVLEQTAPESAPLLVADAEVEPAVDLSEWVDAPAPLAAAVDVEEAPQSAQMGAQDVAYWGMTAATAVALVFAFDWVLF